MLNSVLLVDLACKIFVNVATAISKWNSVDAAFDVSNFKNCIKTRAMGVSCLTAFTWVVLLRQTADGLRAGKILSDSSPSFKKLLVVKSAQCSYNFFHFNSVFAQHPKRVIFYLTVGIGKVLKSTIPDRDTMS